MKIKRIDHVGIIVEDLTAVKNFFLDFGLEMMGEGEVEGEWVERIIGLKDVSQNVVMMRTPDGEANIELVNLSNHYFIHVLRLAVRISSIKNYAVLSHGCFGLFFKL